MPKPPAPDPNKRTLPDGVEFSPQQYWIARMVPMLWIVALTLSLPILLNPSLSISDLGANPEEKLYQRLRSISIKVLARGQTIGSGVILNSMQPTAAGAQAANGNIYTAITNAHVIQSTSAPFHLQTPDGQVYAAALVPPPVTQNRDLTLLRFQSQRIYPTAKLAQSSPKIGDRVWSAGFPVTATTSPTPSDLDPTKAAWNLNVVGGSVTQVLQTAMSGGYGIGIDREIVKGMSGGPLIDRSGDLVGINGIHANPLWDTPDTLEDGSTVNDTLQQQINNSSWAIPIEYVREYIKL